MEKVSCIQVRIGEEFYNIPLHKVEKILMDPQVIPVPDSPEFVVGIGVYEGKGIPFFRLEQISPNDRCRCGVLLLVEGRGPIGIVADEACGMREIPEKDVWLQADEDWKELWGGINGGKTDG